VPFAIALSLLLLKLLLLLMLTPVVMMLMRSMMPMPLLPRRLFRKSTQRHIIYCPTPELSRSFAISVLVGNLLADRIL